MYKVSVMCCPVGLWKPHLQLEVNLLLNEKFTSYIDVIHRRHTSTSYIAPVQTPNSLLTTPSNYQCWSHSTRLYQCTYIIGAPKRWCIVMFVVNRAAKTGAQTHWLSIAAGCQRSSQQEIGRCRMSAIVAISIRTIVTLGHKTVGSIDYISLIKDYVYM